MAKKNRDRDTRREPSGGIRRTEAVRRVEGRIAQRHPALHSEALDLDLSAFQVEVDDRRYDPRAELARTQESSRSGARTILRSNKRADQEASNRGAARAAERKAERAPRANPAIKQGKAIIGKNPARPEHLQAEPSRNVRKETARGACKERPDPKQKGSGASRKYIPWCDRKRR